MVDSARCLSSTVECSYSRTANMDRTTDWTSSLHSMNRLISSCCFGPIARIARNASLGNSFNSAVDISLPHRINAEICSRNGDFRRLPLGNQRDQTQDHLPNRVGAYRSDLAWGSRSSVGQRGNRTRWSSKLVLKAKPTVSTLGIAILIFSATRPDLFPTLTPTS
jgi:hypothetical protein